MSALLDVGEVSAAFAAPRADPCARHFIRLCEDPTREEILVNSLYVSLRGMVEDGSVTQAAADKKLRDYIVSLEETPFVPGFQVFMSARKSAEETLARFPLEQYCADRGIKLFGNGPKRMCRCPLPGHEDKHPSCSVDLDKQLFYCHGAGGPATSFPFMLTATAGSRRRILLRLLTTFAAPRREPTSRLRHRRRLRLPQRGRGALLPKGPLRAGQPEV